MMQLLSFQWIFILFLLPVAPGAEIIADFSTRSLDLQMGERQTITVLLTGELEVPLTVYFTYQEGQSEDARDYQERLLIRNLPNITFRQLNVSSQNRTVVIEGIEAGHVYLGMNSTDPDFTNMVSHYCKVSVNHYHWLVILASVVGWIYFAAWTISFYPQAFLNCRRKSVTGLNFDFLAYNLLGFAAYSCYNVGMYWIPEIMAEYMAENPRGVNPVQLNDVVFSLHAVAITFLTILQCFFFQRDGQRVSWVCVGVISGLLLFILVSVILAGVKVITWLTFLNYISYVKLFITLIKYIPQAWMNFRRKSTEGWSIGNILLDFTGGSLSIVQMFIVSYNFNDWNSIFGDVTKFGLGLFSVLFDILFIAQHYCCYRQSRNNLDLSLQDDDETPILYDTSS